jgi:hypothetical protein
MSKLISIGASHGDEEIIFHLRSISVAEENRYTNRYTAISDLDSDERRSEQEYEILTDSLASWSEKAPTIKNAGAEVVSEDVPVAEGAETKALIPADIVRAFFADRTPEKERTAQQVILQYRRKLQPKVVFY